MDTTPAKTPTVKIPMKGLPKKTRMSITETIISATPEYTGTLAPDDNPRRAYRLSRLICFPDISLCFSSRKNPLSSMPVLSSFVFFNFYTQSSVRNYLKPFLRYQLTCLAAYPVSFILYPHQRGLEMLDKLELALGKTPRLFF